MIKNKVEKKFDLIGKKRVAILSSVQKIKLETVKTFLIFEKKFLNAAQCYLYILPKMGPTMGPTNGANYPSWANKDTLPQKNTLVTYYLRNTCIINHILL